MKGSMHMTQSPNLKLSQHFDALDGLRGVAAVLVFLTHASSRTNMQEVLKVYGLGQIGVMLFFALSGFLMMHVTEGKDCSSNVKSFFVRRLARVYPLYLFVVLAAYFTSFLPGDGRPLSIFRIDDIESVVKHLFLIDGNGVLWTISIEIVFYFLFPIFWIAKSKGLHVFYGSLLLALVVQQTTKAAVDWKTIDVAFLGVIPRGHMFLIGMGLYPIIRGSQAKSAFFDICAIAAIVVLALNLQEVSNIVFGYKIYIWNNLAAVASCGLLLTGALFSKKFSNFLSTKWMVRLGSVSYSIYLTHIFVLNALRVYTNWEETHKITYVAVGFLLTLGVSSLTFRYIEQYFRVAINSNWSRAFKKRENAYSNQTFGAEDS